MQWRDFAGGVGRGRDCVFESLFRCRSAFHEFRVIPTALTHLSLPVSSARSPSSSEEGPPSPTSFPASVGGFWKSSSWKPTARSIALDGAFCIPSVTSRERGFTSTGVLADVDTSFPSLMVARLLAR